MYVCENIIGERMCGKVFNERAGKKCAGQKPSAFITIAGKNRTCYAFRPMVYLTT